MDEDLRFAGKGVICENRVQGVQLYKWDVEVEQVGPVEGTGNFAERVGFYLRGQRGEGGVAENGDFQIRFIE